MPQADNGLVHVCFEVEDMMGPATNLVHPPLRSRAFIRAALKEPCLDVPSPTYLLQNTYEDATGVVLCGDVVLGLMILPQYGLRWPLLVLRPTLPCTRDQS